MARQQHSFESVADDLSQWIDETSDHLVGALKENGRAPFEQPMTAKERYDYYHEQLYNTDGTVNAAGRQAMIDKLGIAGYTKVAMVVNQGNGVQIGADGSLPDGHQWVAGGPESLPQPETQQTPAPGGGTWVAGG